MPPPAPRELNKWVMLASVGLIATGFLTSMRNRGKPGSVFQRVTDESAAPAMSSAPAASSAPVASASAVAPASVSSAAPSVSVSASAP